MLHPPVHFRAMKRLRQPYFWKCNAPEIVRLKTFLPSQQRSYCVWKQRKNDFVVKLNRNSHVFKRSQTNCSICVKRCTRCEWRRWMKLKANAKNANHDHYPPQPQQTPMSFNDLLKNPKRNSIPGFAKLTYAKPQRHFIVKKLL
eukprot:PhF_6_TR2287/c0_g1_i2/m.3982